MHFSTILTAIISASSMALEIRQEAARFGIAMVHPRNFTGGSDVVISYNASTARHHPKFVDFYVQGAFAGTSNLSPWFLIQRNDFAPDQQFLELNMTMPAALNNVGVSGWGLTAWVTFDADGLTQIGGIQAGNA
ncbi:hypothetical protein D9758_004417 [Tetrapyrgos nigripes]|uniref:Uncharacterized protein n=1 Tax=Tetrapyrgos nigripes TaxID=182062 RepID=A0A8H5GNL9_9AGAR|nr:hypothetical protein D9758_004417 [Tetrapyrgos nigripes]